MKLSIIWICPYSCFFLSLRIKFSPVNSVLKTLGLFLPCRVEDHVRIPVRVSTALSLDLRACPKSLQTKLDIVS